MLRMTWMSAAAVANYFENHLAPGDYFGDDLSAEAGIWHGLGAERLGLSGEIDGNAFKNLAYNRLPNSDEKLTPRDVPGHPRAVLSMDFSVPKGVSLVYLIGQDHQIKEAFQEAVRHTMANIEMEAKSRVRDKGASHDISTGNLIWGEFIHKTSRPVRGTSDPQLHAHSVVFNATYREDKKGFRALQAGDLKRDAPYFQAIFTERFCENMQGLGYVMEPTAVGMDIAGISKAIKDKYSRRRDQVEQLAERLNITDPELKALLGPQTREAKSSNKLTWLQQQQEWRDRLSASEYLSILLAKENSQREPVVSMDATKAMSLAVEHCFERRSVVSHRSLVAKAAEFGVGQVSIKELEGCKPEGLIQKEVHGQVRCTLQGILESELKMLHLVRKGKFAVQPLRENYEAFMHDYLNEGQRGAIQHILGSKDRVTLISGKAGVGKTTLTKEISAALNTTGKKINAFAPTAQASRTVLRESGFKDANTVASLLAMPDHSHLKNQVILIDEVGLLGVEDARKVFELAERQNARVILSGDRLQHQAVGGGGPALNVLENSKLVQPYHVSEVVRQEGAFKEAIQDITNEKFEKAIEAFDKAGWIMEADNAELYASIAKDYVKTHHMKEPNLVVVPTHKESHVVSAFIRKSLIERKQLGKRETIFKRLDDLKYSRAEKKQAESYQAEDIVQFNEPAASFKKGASATVLDVTGEEVYLMSKEGREIKVPLDQMANCNVFRPDELGVRKGELLQITRNGYDKNGFALNNGDRVKVKTVNNDGDLVLANGKIIPKTYQHFKLGYTNTSFASQGKSVPMVQVLMNDAVKGAINKAQFYVSVSRGKHRAQIYTNDKQEFKQWVHKPSDKEVGHDLVGYPKDLLKTLSQADRQRRLYHYITLGMQRTKTAFMNRMNRRGAMIRSGLGKGFQLPGKIRIDLGRTEQKPIDWRPPETKRLDRNLYRGWGRPPRGRDDNER